MGIKEQLLESQLGGFKVVIEEGGVDFGAIEGIRAGAQDELEDIQDAKVKFPDHLKNIEATKRDTNSVDLGQTKKHLRCCQI